MREPSERAPLPELVAFLAPYGVGVSRLYLEVRAFVLQHCPEANELIYDSYNAVSCVYSFTGSMNQGFCHVAAYPSHVNLGFNDGASLDDPSRLLQGSGKRIRHIRIDASADIGQAGCEALLKQAIGLAEMPESPVRGVSVVKAISDNKRRP